MGMAKVKVYYFLFYTHMDVVYGDIGSPNLYHQITSLSPLHITTLTKASLHENEISARWTHTMLYDARFKLNNVISVYRDDWYWSAWKYLEVEKQRIHQNNARLLRIDRTNRDQRLPCGFDLLQYSLFGDWNIINERLTGSVPAFIRTGEAFFRNGELNINAMLKAFTLPGLFITTTFSEQWKEYQAILEKVAGNNHGNPTDFPWAAVQYYYERMHHFKQYLLRNPKVNGFGKLHELVERYEFQLRQAIHTHMLLWVERSIPDMIRDNFIRADVPDPHSEPELYELVMQHQIHTCKAHLCGSSNATPQSHPCKKGFPQPLAQRTHCVPGELRYRYRRSRPQDQFVVPYNPQLLLIWRAHLNCQYVTTAGLSKYVTKYVTKTEPESIVSVMEPNGDTIRKHLESRRIGAMETICLLDSKPILKLSSQVEFLTNTLPEMRTKTVRPVSELERVPNDPYYPDTVMKYFGRPVDPMFDTITYPQYFQQFVLARRRRPACVGERNRQREEWKDGRGYFVYRRTKPQLTRSPFRRLADAEAFFYSLLLEKHAWRSEDEILEDCHTYRERFIELYPGEYDVVIQEQCQGRHTYELYCVNLYEELLTAIVESGPVDVEHIITDQMKSLRRPPVQWDTSKDSYDATLHMSEDQYVAFSILSDMFDSLPNDPSSQRLFFVTGSAGVGKSYLLSAIEKRLQNRRLPFLKLAPTGIAAVNIGGQTIHSALSMTTSHLGTKSTSYMTSIFRSEEMQMQMRTYSVLLIDEISMVSAELLSFISRMFGRLHSNGRPFGNICVVAFGDLLQLPPVVGQQVFKSPVWSLFFPIILSQSRRQEGDFPFIKILNEIRIGKISKQSWNALHDRHMQYSPTQTLYRSTFIVSHRKTAENLNDLVLSSVDSEPQMHICIDREGSRVLELQQSSHAFKSATNLPDQVDTRRGSRVMFLENSLIALGISNGTTGVVNAISEKGNPIVIFPTSQGIEVCIEQKVPLIVSLWK
jgi:DNA replication protein DnaC